MYSLRQILTHLGETFTEVGLKKSDKFRSIKSYIDATEDSLIFINKINHKNANILFEKKFAAAIIEGTWGYKNITSLKKTKRKFFLVKEPRVIFGRIMGYLYPDEIELPSGIHPSAIIHPEARIHRSVFVGDHCIIGKCTIGENSRIYPFSIIRDGSIIGKNVIIREYCLIGGTGFGFVRNEKRCLERIPHIGNVIIEDDVELFPYVNVDRGTLSATIIKRGTKVDHYCHIGHNSSIGQHCLITAGTVFCGGSSIGSFSWAGVHTVFKEKISVGKNVITGLGSVILNEVGDNKTIAGVPARILKGKKC